MFDKTFCEIKQEDLPAQPKLTILLSVTPYLQIPADKEERRIIVDLSLITFYHLLQVWKYNRHGAEDKQSTKQFQATRKPPNSTKSSSTIVGTTIFTTNSKRSRKTSYSSFVHDLIRLANTDRWVHLSQSKRQKKNKTIQSKRHSIVTQWSTT